MENNTVVALSLGGKLWELKLGHKALMTFTTLTKTPMSQLGQALDRYDLLTVLLYAMLWVQDHTVTRVQLDDWLEGADIIEVFTRVSEAAAAAFPTPEDGEATPEAEENPPEAAGIGEIV